MRRYITRARLALAIALDSSLRGDRAAQPMPAPTAPAT